MTILVTGGAGYIGSHVVQELLDSRHRAVVLDDLSTGFRHAVPNTVPLVAGSVGDGDRVSRLLAEHDVDAIMHFAASSVVPDSVADPIAYYNNNTTNSLVLMKAAARAGIKHFVFSSTAAVYGNPAITPVDEDFQPQPMSPYGTSKLMTEMMLHDLAVASEFAYVVLRYFNVAGADPKLRTGQSSRAATHLIKVALQAALGRRERIEIYGTDYPTPDGTCIRDYVHVTDLAKAHIKALEYLRAGGESITLNCGYGHGSSVRDVIATVKRITSKDFAVMERGRRPGDPALIVADVERIRRVLSWTPEYDDLELMVGHAFAWEKKLTENSVA